MKTRYFLWTGILTMVVAYLTFSPERFSTLIPDPQPATHSDPQANVVSAHQSLWLANGSSPAVILNSRTDFQNSFGGSLSAGLQWLEHSCTVDQRSEAVSLFVDYWIKIAPKDALLGAHQIQDKHLRNHYITALAEHSSLDFVSSTKLTESVTSYPKIFHIWTETVVSRWQEVDLPAVLTWSEHSEPDLRAEILIKALPFWAKSDPSGAAGYHDSTEIKLPFDTKRRIGIEWARVDGDAALEWLSTLRNPTENQVAIRTALMAYAEKYPQKAAEYALRLPSEKDQLEACVGIAETLARSAPQRAADWISEFPAGDAYDQAVFAVFREYSKRDLQATGEWLYNLPIGTARDKALGEYVQALENRFPEIAADWAMQIRDDSERDRRLKNVIEAWSRVDLKAAKSWERAHGNPGRP